MRTSDEGRKSPELARCRSSAPRILATCPSDSTTSSLTLTICPPWQFWTQALGGKNRVHLDLTSSAAGRDQEIDRLLALGARRVDIGQTGTEFWTCPCRP
ncbi:VOC family protein [Bradyrhizobium sp.]|uniref:VOC family protein n=1 Tax=Bradyrhizobium sp. TaxID=376 RepID=UPI003C6FC362